MLSLIERNAKLTRLEFQSIQNGFAQHNEINHLSSRKVANEDSLAKRGAFFLRAATNLFSLKGQDAEPTEQGTEFLAEQIRDPLGYGPSTYSGLVSHGSEERIITLRNTLSVHLLKKPCKNV